MIAALVIALAGAAPAELSDANVTNANLIVTDARALIALEDKGLGAGAVAFETKSARNNADLAGDAMYLSIVHTLGADLRELYAKDPAWGPGMRFTHRGFDARWLTSKDTRWELAAVVNRLDRKAFNPGTCGEARFIYRLAYTTQTKSGAFSSRLPATLNVVFLLPDDGHACRSAAERLMKPVDVDVATRAQLKSVEIDVQTARWPSTVRPDLGGHADYILRVFHPKDGKLVPSPLENTPDVDRIAHDPALKREVLAWLAQHAADVDNGTALLPEKFLALRAVSVTPRGLARPANRPWSKLLADTDVTALLKPTPPSSSSSSSLGSRAALLRRLDGLTCMGCHQSRSIAGFHVVGADRNGSSVDALAVGVSPHLEEDLPRRRAYVEALLRGVAVDERRRPPEHELDRGGFGDSCGLGDAGFASWTCADGFACTGVDDDVVGQCMPTRPAAGSACSTGHVDQKRDRIARSTSSPCAERGFCEDVPVGFPGGMCAAGCDNLGDHAACGGIAVLTPFNDCLARGELFSECAKHATPAALRACGPNDPCRPDYICAGAGVCLPPYFVLQMRVDGHPLK